MAYTIVVEALSSDPEVAKIVSLEGDMTSDIHKVLTHIKIFIQQHRIGNG